MTLNVGQSARSGKSHFAVSQKNYGLIFQPDRHADQNRRTRKINGASGKRRGGLPRRRYQKSQPNSGFSWTRAAS
jgi:hypothetical protein